MTLRSNKTWLRPFVAGPLWLAAAAAAVFGPTLAAGLAVTTPVITINPNSGPPATTSRVAGHGFCAAPCTVVTIKVGTILVPGNIEVAANGTFSTCIEIPGSVRPPTANVTASQRDQNGALVSASAVFTVTPNAPPPTQCSPVPSTPPVQRSPTPTRNPASPSARPSTAATPSAGPTPSAPAGSPQASAGPASGGGTAGPGLGLWIAIGIALLIALGVIAVVFWRSRAQS